MLSSRLAQLALVILTLSLVGVGGFVLTTGCSVFDAWYLTVITLSTVGYGETIELDSTGRLFAGMLITVAWFVMAWCLARVTSVLIEGDLTGAVRKRRMENKVKRMKNHIVICGAGPFARASLENLPDLDSSQVVVVSPPGEELDQLRETFPELRVIEQVPTCDLALARAGVLTARIIIIATTCDMDNFLIAMSCRESNPQVRLFAVSQDRSLARRMDKLGVDEVICPFLLFGTRIAGLISAEPRGTSGAFPTLDGTSPDWLSQVPSGEV